MEKLAKILWKPFNRFLSRIDQYIISNYIKTTVFTFGIITAIAVVIDYSEKTENFVKNKPSAQEVLFDYYLNFIPHITALLAPLLIFLAVIIFTSRLAYNSEIIAMLNSGMSYRRFLRPYLIAAVASALLVWYANHWLVPIANKTRITFEDKYVRPPKSYGNDIHMRLDEQTFITLNRFKYASGEGNLFALEKYSGKGAKRKLVYKINAERIQHIPGSNNWRLLQYRRWHINGLEERFEKGRQMDTLLNMEPEDFDVNTIIKEALNYRELQDFMEEERLRGAGGLEFYEVEQHRRTASAISVIIMIVIGAIMGAQKVRGGMGLNIVAAIAMGALYVVFLQFSSSFSVNGSLPPVIGANVPNIIYGFLALYLFNRYNK